MTPPAGTFWLQKKLHLAGGLEATATNGFGVSLNHSVFLLERSDTNSSPFSLHIPAGTKSFAVSSQSDSGLYSSGAAGAGEKGEDYTGGFSQAF